MKPYTGLEVYRGPSELDGQDIVVILTLNSTNKKTGAMCQTWILRTDMPPQDAVKKGADESICGQCTHRHHLGGACYVLPFQAPNKIYQSWKAGNYPVATRRHLNRLRGRAIRFGSYGDPAAAPVEVWRRLKEVASITTGYTHQVGRLPDIGAMDLLDYCMVSADSEGEALFYQSMGASTFRVKNPEDPLLAGEVYCPADARDDIQCLDCGLCSGAGNAKTSIAINVHGARKKRFDPIPAVELHEEAVVISA